MIWSSQVFFYIFFMDYFGNRISHDEYTWPIHQFDGRTIYFSQYKGVPATSKNSNSETNLGVFATSKTSDSNVNDNVLAC